MFLVQPVSFLVPIPTIGRWQPLLREVGPHRLAGPNHSPQHTLYRTGTAMDPTQATGDSQSDIIRTVIKMSQPAFPLIRERALALSAAQRKHLSELITSKSILLDPNGGYTVIAKKQKAWEEVAVEFNGAYPQDQPKKVIQLKRAWEYVRKR